MKERKDTWANTEILGYVEFKNTCHRDLFADHKSIKWLCRIVLAFDWVIGYEKKKSVIFAKIPEGGSGT